MLLPSPRILTASVMLSLLAACSAPQLERIEDEDEDDKSVLLTSSSGLDADTIQSTTKVMAAANPNALVTNPILFVTQVPTAGDQFASRTSTFANHLAGIGSVPRGGDLMIRYPDGTLRNLTKEAGFGMEGQQGTNAIAVREPTVHWDGNKAIFSMVVGAPPRYQHSSAPWQIYEVTGLARGQTAVIKKIEGQPTQYNNVSPLYGSDDKILFTSDRPRDGQAHLHPQLDEYESTPTIVGIYLLDPVAKTFRLLNHTPSGAFNPIIDSAGRVIFTRWDHLQRDQQAEVSTYGSYNYPSEAAGAAPIALQPETFPESRTGMNSPYGQVAPFTYNLFTPWQMNQDGTDELSLNHIGRHELSFNYLGRSFLGDNALVDTPTLPIANKTYIRGDGGLFNFKEDPTSPGIFYSIYTREFSSMTTGQIIRLNGGVGTQAENISLEGATPYDVGYAYSGGRYRNPLPLTSGAVVAAYTPITSAQIPTSTTVTLRLQKLTVAADGKLSPGTNLTSGISKTVSWWDPDNQRSYSGVLWEMEPVEVVARTRPPQPTLATEAPEKTVFQQEGVDEAVFRQWMKDRNLSLIVVRNQTHRDRSDRQQPFNLRVPGGTSTTAGNGIVYDISHFQIFQGNMVRAYNGYNAGRRPIAQPINAATHNPPTNGPVGSVPIASDGSSAVFVPSSRALTWQTTDNGGNGIVRERLWVTMQPGEIRTCSGCHGENVAHQGGGPASTAQAQALRTLLRYWKSQQEPAVPVRVNGSQPLVPTRG